MFEGANRIVVEKPCYGHATYFFDLEEPLPVSAQVCRLIPPNSNVKTFCRLLAVSHVLFYSLLTGCTYSLIQVLLVIQLTDYLACLCAGIAPDMPATVFRLSIAVSTTVHVAGNTAKVPKRLCTGHITILPVLCLS